MVAIDKGNSIDVNDVRTGVIAMSSQIINIFMSNAYHEFLSSLAATQCSARN